jgi:ATP-dependent Lon protease
MLRNDDSKLYEKTQQMLDEIHLLKNSMSEIERALDDSVYGHKTAKNQIVKIISQWISGENSGHCFGFEGSPGVGKTSLAKIGLSNCLKDEQGKSRPFAFIAVGGSCNGSTLEGHGYTYVNSSWGKIADVLMEHSCLNLIIYFDELDKESKNGEHGKEITGILTHLLDQSQNSEFEDKFFAGIKLDLSKALIIVSYNDPNNIDKVLLDRIHRIKFKLIKRIKRQINFNLDPFKSKLLQLQCQVNDLKNDEYRILYLDEAVFTLNSFSVRAWSLRNQSIAVTEEQTAIKT